MTTAQALWIVACSSAFLPVAFLQQVDFCRNYPECSKLQNFNLPDCGKNAKPSLVRECAENNVRNGKSCKMFVQRSFQSYADGVRLAEKTVCETPGLHSEFGNRSKCWRGAVSCVAGHLGSSGQDHTPEMCKLSIHSVTKCTDEKSSDCIPLQRRFVDHAIARTSCHGYTSYSARHSLTWAVLIINMVIAFIGNTAIC